MPHVDGRQIGEPVGAVDPLKAVNLPDAGDGKEDQHGREEAGKARVIVLSSKGVSPLILVWKV